MSWKPVGEPEISMEELNKQNLKKLVSEAMTEEGQTLVHCRYRSKEKYVNGGWINIWPETFLQNPETLEKIRMSHAVHVPLAPEKHLFSRQGEYKSFTLIFPLIPVSWKSFCLVEYAGLESGFCVRNIPRNNSGVYHVNLY